jgi:uridine kinase
MKPYLIGIAGRSCSGKTTLVRELQKTNTCTYICQDQFFKRQEDATRWEEPECLRNDLLLKSITQLKNGESTHVSQYGCSDLVYYPRPIIIVEGYLLFVDKNISDLFDKRVWVDVSDINLVCRRIQRDGSLKYIDKILYAVLPTSKKYEPIQKSRADIIIDGNKDINNVVKEFNRLVKL